jgi:hypothetical protein
MPTNVLIYLYIIMEDQLFVHILYLNIIKKPISSRAPVRVSRTFQYLSTGFGLSRSMVLASDPRPLSPAIGPRPS